MAGAGLYCFKSETGNGTYKKHVPNKTPTNLATKHKMQ